MRILFVNSERGVAGGLTSAVELACGLTDAGHETIVACHPASELRRRLESAGVPVEPVAIRAEINAWRAVQIASILRREPVDVVLADRRKDVKLAFGALRLQPGPALVHRHGSPSPVRDSAIYRAIWTRLQRMIVNSESMRRLQLEVTPWIAATPIDVIYNGKDMSAWRPQPDERTAVRAELGIGADEFVVVFHGVLQGRKNVDILIRACAATAPPRPHALIIGEGPEREPLEAEAAALGVGATFTGARTDIARLLSAADAAIHLSRAEGFSNSVVEALACGLPVVASDATSHREQVRHGETGFLVELRNERATAQALEKLRADPALLAGMARSARADAVDRFGIDRMIDGYVDSLRRAMKKP